MALAHLQRWQDAHAALLAGHRECPQQERFAVELAGVAFELKHYPEAAADGCAMRFAVNPHDEYANNFAGTVYLLMGNVNAALKYWNRVQKPYIAAIRFRSATACAAAHPGPRFCVLSGGDVLSARDFETTQARLDALSIFATYNIVLNARSDEKFDADFHALSATVSAAAGCRHWFPCSAELRTRPSIPRTTTSAARLTNVESLLRWDRQKRRAWLSASTPLHNRPQWRGTLQLDARDENWDIRNSFTGTAPVLGSFDLERQSATAFLTGIPSGRLQWSAGAELAHRSFHGVVPGSALTPSLVEPGFELKALGSVQAQIIEVPERRFTVDRERQFRTRAPVARHKRRPRRMYSASCKATRRHVGFRRLKAIDTKPSSASASGTSLACSY